MRTSMVLFDSRICPAPSGDPSSTSSSPVEITPTFTRGYTTTCVALMLANTPSIIGVTRMPAVTTVAPTATSDPAARIAAPAGTDFRIFTLSVPTRSVSSTMTTQSQPSGIGAPVIMRIAVPGVTAMVGAAPAASSPITRNSTGTFATSDDRTA